MERLTSQKKFIIEYLKNTTSHPTAEEIYLEVKKKLPTISKGTVYRILKNLKRKEEIQIIPKGFIAHYDGNTLPHPHFICESCGKVFDLNEKIKISKIPKRTKVGKINKYQLFFYGTCQICQKSKKKK